MRTLLLIADGYPYWIEGPQMLVKTDEQRSTEVSSTGSKTFMLTRYFCPVDSSNWVPTVVVALRGVVTPWHRQINYNAIMLKCPAGYNIVEPPNPYVQPDAPRRYRRVVVGQNEYTGQWHRHVADAVRDLMTLVRGWFDRDEPVSEMMLDAQAGVESAVIADGGEPTQEKWHGNFYDCRDLAITKGWMAPSGGVWLLSSTERSELQAALTRVQQQIAENQIDLPADVVKAVNEQFWDLV